jgi:Flp pilus assembly protein TadG
MTMRRLADRLNDERGEAPMITGLLLLVGVLIPLMFLVVLFGRIELAQVNVQQAARDAVRAAVQAPNSSAAHAAATAALGREQPGSHTAMTLNLTGTYARGEVMSAQVTTQVHIGSLPFLGHFGIIVVHGRASAPVDRYRSILRPGAP